MTLIAIASAKGSPGVTTTALALAHTWPTRVLLAECDPAGGDIAAGYLAGQVEPGLGLTELIIAARRSDLDSALPGHLLGLDELRTRLLLPGLRDAGHAAALEPWWDRLAALFTDLRLDDSAIDVLADCGRLATPDPPRALLRRADVVALVLRPTLRSVAQAQAALVGLRRDLADPARLIAILAGEGQPYTAREVGHALDVPILVLDHDPRAAAVFSDGTGGGRRFASSSLLRSARTVADQLARRSDPIPAGPPSAVAGHAAPAMNGRRVVPTPQAGGSPHA